MEQSIKLITYILERGKNVGGTEGGSCAEHYKVISRSVDVNYLSLLSRCGLCDTYKSSDEKSLNLNIYLKSDIICINPKKILVSVEILEHKSKKICLLYTSRCV